MTLALFGALLVASGIIGMVVMLKGRGPSHPSLEPAPRRHQPVKPGRR